MKYFIIGLLSFSAGGLAMGLQLKETQDELQQFKFLLDSSTVALYRGCPHHVDDPLWWQDPDGHNSKTDPLKELYKQ